jgi:predicted ATPase
MGEATISAEFADILHQRTDGNPFFVHQVVQALVDQGDVYRHDGR